MLELIKEFKPLIMEGLQRVQQPAQVLPAAPALAAVPGNLEIPANNPATDETGEDMFLNMFVKPQLEKLISAARSNEDVEKHANDVIDITPPAILDDWIDAPQLLETLGAINPGVKNFPDWFTKLFAKIRELTSDDEPAQDTGNNP
jgi:hypothetical protein